MKRANVWWVSFDPSLGGEIQKTRPAVIVSNDAANASLNRLQVVPITSNTSRLYPCEAYVTLKGEQRKAMADQIATVAKMRLKEKIGTLSSADMQAIEQAIRLQLGF
ncbi:MAG: type II toxin-antitoxin system PemK/MazF family toxin [Rhodospirillales bacterium]|jgi:mRNA interferase MazF|nr:type II toxin-antitoxin system PemK/MazF family toxin [Rhodospirillales bacterium]